MITVITQPQCVYCTQAKKWLRQQGVDFTEVPASSRTDVKGVPVLITPRERVDGWSEKTWSRVLAQHQQQVASAALEHGRCIDPPAFIMNPSAREPSGQIVTTEGASCGKRVTPANVGVMVTTLAVTGVTASESWIPVAGIVGAILYAIGVYLGVCKVRALGTGFMGGAAVAAVRHCVQADRENARLDPGSVAR